MAEQEVAEQEEWTHDTMIEGLRRTPEKKENSGTVIICTKKKNLHKKIQIINFYLEVLNILVLCPCFL